jgi:signal transduction histidine kinase
VVTVAGMTSATVWPTLRSPVRLLAGVVPWRSLGYLATGVPVGLLALVLLPPLVLTGVGPAVLGVTVAATERRRLRLVDAAPAVSPHRRPVRAGPLGWLATRLREPATWQELAFALLSAVLWPVELAVVMTAVGLTVLPLTAPVLVAVLPAAWIPNGVRLDETGLIWLLPVLGAAAFVVMAYVVTIVAGGRAALTRAMLVPPDGIRLVELTRSRTRLVEGFDRQRQRIERDLHDGVQQRLLSLSVTLGLARIASDAAAATGAGRFGELDRLITQAHQESKAIVDQLRDLVRGIHPWLLTDRGLSAAIAELAARSSVPVTLDLDIHGRLPPSVETTSYYTISEALTNVDKHSGAGQATVSAHHRGGRLTVEVRDDGRGGADAEQGTGLQGLADRAEAAGARLLVASPSGGGTIVRLEVPCHRRRG